MSEQTFQNRLFMLESTGGGQMNSFVIQTASGGLIIIDGGYRHDAQHLLRRLRAISGQEVPVVDGWFLSHAHLDHIEAFLEIMENHRDAVDVKKIYYNFPSEQYLTRWEPQFAFTIREFYQKLPLFVEKTVIISETDRYEIGGAAFDILYSPDPSFTGNTCNNSSIIMRMTLGSKTVLFTGDAGVEAGQKLLAKMGSALKSDICQMAHHGQNGVERDFYEAASPEACLWCTPQWLWDNDNGDGYDTFIWKTVEVRRWMDEIGVKEHYVMKDGEQVIELGEESTLRR